VVDITLAGGQARINGNPIGSYQPGDALDLSWRKLLDSVGSLSTSDILRAAKAWTVPELSGPEVGMQQAMASDITRLPAVPLSVIANQPPLPPGPPGQEKAPVPIRLPRLAPTYGGLAPSLLGLLGAFVALACIAFGLVSFFPRQLDIVSQTVQNSFVRSFFAGLFAQPLLLPALGTLIVALILTVVGILVIPVAIVAFCLAVSTAVVGGYIATARALGEIYLRRTGQAAKVSGDPTYRAALVGLGLLLLIWAPFALLGWIPVIGLVLFLAAVVFTWVMATAGLGATILSGAGLRDAFRRRIDAQVSGELSWSTLDQLAPSRRGEDRVP
jgi:hypothetical protein